MTLILMMDKREMQQLKALPFSKLKKGLRIFDLAAMPTLYPFMGTKEAKDLWSK